MIIPRPFLLPTLLLILTSLVFPTTAIHFYAKHAEPKCFYEELFKDTLVVGKVQAQIYSEEVGEYVEPANFNLKITVEESFDKDHKLIAQSVHSSSSFTFSALESGEHLFCFTPINSHNWFNGNGQVRISFDLDIGEDHPYLDTTSHDRVTRVLAKIGELKGLLEELRRAQELVIDREKDFRDESETINTKVITWTILQLCVLGIACYWQLHHLKNFFLKQKFI